MKRTHIMAAIAAARLTSSGIQAVIGSKNRLFVSSAGSDVPPTFHHVSAHKNKSSEVPRALLPGNKQTDWKGKSTGKRQQERMKRQQERLAAKKDAIKPISLF